MSSSPINSIAIEVTSKAFLPESYAYRDYFRQHGFACDFVEKGSPDALHYDAIVLFHGLHPFWCKYPKFIIGEYHSLSTGSYSRIKDLVKRLINVRANLYIFLNEEVRKKLWFSKNTDYLTRSMGYNKADFEEFKSQNKVFDIVYCGSYREGLYAELTRLADMGASIALVGPENPIKHENITSFGRKIPKEARKIIAQAKYGLNYTPDVFPLNIQDSTKVIEYCAAGLGVITNRYQWVNAFEKQRHANFLSLESIRDISGIAEYEFIVPDVTDLSWDTLMEKSGIVSKIKSFTEVE